MSQIEFDAADVAGNAFVKSVMEFYAGLSAAFFMCLIWQVSLVYRTYKSRGTKKVFEKTSQPKRGVLLQDAQYTAQVKQHPVIQQAQHADTNMPIPHQPTQQFTKQTPELSTQQPVEVVSAQNKLEPIKPKSERSILLEQLLSKFNKLHDDRGLYPIVAEFKKEHCHIRRKAADDSSGLDSFIIEKNIFGVVPAQFMKLLESIELATKFNKQTKRVDLIAVEEADGYKVEIYASHVISPTRLISGRIFVDAKYVLKDQNVILMSSQGNERYKEQYMASTDLDGYAEAFCVMSAHRYTPIFDTFNKEKIIGTKLVFINESDFGGNVPKWITQKFAPSALNDFTEDLAEAAKTMSVE